MRLNAGQKAAVLDALPGRRDGGRLVRSGALWLVVWFESEQPHGERWRAQVVRRVDGGVVWWAPEVGGRTKRDAVTLAVLE